MQYTVSELLNLVQEARGHVHEVMMGATWTKERYDRCLDFMDRTNNIAVKTEDDRIVVGTALDRVNVRKALDHAKKVIQKVAAKPFPDPVEGTVEVTINVDKPAESIKINLDPVPAPTRGRPPSLGHVKPGSIRAMAEEIACLGYRIPDMSIDAEAASLRARHLPASRDLARAIVKELRLMAVKKAG